MQSVRTFSSVGTAVLGNFRTVLLIFMSAMILGELKDWGATRYIGCINAFIGAAAYGLHPKLFGTPVSRELPQTLMQDIQELRTTAVAEGSAREHEREGLATPGKELGDVDEEEEDLEALEIAER